MNISGCGGRFVWLFVYKYCASFLALFFYVCINSINYRDQVCALNCDITQYLQKAKSYSELWG